ncbi:MAG: DUF4423 domain-containing protein [Bdellovibrionota bacterium]
MASASAASYREILLGEFKMRVATNSAYSLRAYARDLGLSSSRLSAIMKGHEGLSRQVAEKVSQKIGLSPSMTEHFCDLVDSEHARSEIKRKLARARIEAARFKSEHRLSLDSFQLLSEWQHFALREMVRLKRFRLDFAQLAARLEIEEKLVREAWQRLLRMNLVHQDPVTKAWSTVDDVQSPVGEVSTAIQNYHRQMLDKAHASLSRDPFSQRYFSSIVVPMDPKRISEAGALIREFRRSFESKLPQDTEATDVYCLSLNFFNVTPGPGLGETLQDDNTRVEVNK